MKPLPDACQDASSEAEEESPATTGGLKSLSFSLMLQVAFSFQGPYRIDQSNKSMSLEP